MELLKLLLIPLYAVFNRIRGTTGSGGVIGGVLTGIIVFIFTNNPIASGVVALLYFTGEMVGWGRWLKTVPHWGDRSYQETYMANREKDRGKVIHAIADAIVKEETDFTAYAKIALFIRGVYWWAPISIAMVAFGISNPVLAAIAVLIAGLAFPFSYNLSYKLFKEKYWGYGERIYGAFHGIILILLLGIDFSKISVMM